MSKKRMMQGMVVGCLMMVAVGGWSTTTVKAEESAYTDQGQIITSREESEKERAAQTVWYFKEENGKKYRRLWDATNQKWLTDWILCE